MKHVSKATPYFWGAADIITEQLVQIFLLIYLSRRLSPEIFGLYATLQSITMLSMLIVDSGLSAGIITFQIHDRKKINSIFTLNLLIAIFLVTFLLSTKEYVVNWFGIQKFGSIYMCAVLLILLDALGMTQYSQLKRDLRFKSIAMITFFAVSLTLFSVLGSIGLLSDEYIILVLLSTPRIIRLFGYALTNKQLPKIDFRFRDLIDEIKFGGRLLYLSILNWSNKGVLVFFVGGNLGVSALGYFNRASSLQNLAAKTTSTLLNRVGFSVLSKLKNQNSKVLANYRNSKLVLLLGLILIALPIQIFADQVVQLLLGSSWQPSAHYLIFLIPLGVILPFNDVNMTVAKSQGRIDALLLLDTVEKFSFVILVFSLSKYSLELIITTVALLKLLCLIISDLLVSKLLSENLYKLNVIVYLFLSILLLLPFKDLYKDLF